MLRPGVLKTVGFCACGAITISYLTKLKEQDLVATQVPLPRLEWMHGTSDKRLQQAIEADDGEAVSLLLDEVPKDKIRPNMIERLAYDRTCRCLEAFLSRGWSPEGVAKKGYPILHAARDGQDRAVALLLAHGARADVSDENQRTALVWACASYRSGPEMIRMLISHGAKLEALDSVIAWRPGPNQPAQRVKARALSVAASVGNRATVQALLELGANPNGLPGEVLPPIIAAAVSGAAADTTAMLLKAGAEPDEKGETLVRIAPRKWEKARATALYFNAGYNHYRAVRLLLEHGANPLLKSSTGKTCFDIARPESLEVLREIGATRVAVRE